jgi:hypothetical protein
MGYDDAGIAVSDDEQTQAVHTVVEWSRDGALMIETDHTGAHVRVQLEPEVNRLWPADVLADRIMRLHRLALMRARAEVRMNAIEETGAPVPTTPGWPSFSEVEEYRRTIDF